MAADISDLKDRVGKLESKVADLEENAKKANNRLGKADASLSKARDVLAKANKRQKKAAKKLNRAESVADDARKDLGLVRFGANLARDIESRDDAETENEDDQGLLGVTSAADLSEGGPSLVDLSVEATAAEREATISAVKADWAGAGARVDLRRAKQEVSKAAEKRDEVAKERKKANAAAEKSGKKLDNAEDKLDNVESKLSTAVEKKRAAEREAEREAAAEKAARAEADRTASPGTGQTTSPYGMRTHPITGVHKLHSGTDFSYGDGKAYAARSGTVASVGYSGGYGNMVTLSHGNGLQTRYAHLASPTVSTGEQVSAGEVVGQIGSTGYSTGAHLHFEVLRNGDFVNADDWLGQ